MQAYTVYEAPIHANDRIDRGENLVFVKDGFSWAAFLFAPIWMLVNRLWWPLLAYLVVVVALQVLGAMLGQPSSWLTLLAFGINLVLGFEASTVRRWTLERGGWTMVGAITGRNLEDCERAFFQSWLPAQPMIATTGSTGSSRRSPLGSIAQLFGARP